MRYFGPVIVIAAFSVCTYCTELQSLAAITQDVQCTLATIEAQCTSGYIDDIASDLRANGNNNVATYVESLCETNADDVSCYTVAQQAIGEILNVFEQCIVNVSGSFDEDCPSSCRNALEMLQDVVESCFLFVDNELFPTTGPFTEGLVVLDFQSSIAGIPTSPRFLSSLSQICQIEVEQIGIKKLELQFQSDIIIANHACLNGTRYLSAIDNQTCLERASNYLTNICKIGTDNTTLCALQQLGFDESFFFACQSILSSNIVNTSIQCPDNCREEIVTVTGEIGCCFEATLANQAQCFNEALQTLFDHCSVQVPSEDQCPSIFTPPEMPTTQAMLTTAIEINSTSSLASNSTNSTSQTSGGGRLVSIDIMALLCTLVLSRGLV